MLAEPTSRLHLSIIFSAADWADACFYGDREESGAKNVGNITEGVRSLPSNGAAREAQRQPISSCPDP